MYLLVQETCPRVDDIRFIPLTRGLFAKVSARHYVHLMRWRWCAQWNPHTRSFYATRKTTAAEGRNKTTVVMSRVILGLDSGDKRQAEHKNHDTLDNTDNNLRIATTSQNQGNRRKPRTNTTGFKGVSECWRRGRFLGYMAQIIFQGKWTYLGLHLTPQLAHEAYCAKALELHGEFARAG